MRNTTAHNHTNKSFQKKAWLAALLTFALCVGGGYAAQGSQRAWADEEDQGAAGNVAAMFASTKEACEAVRKQTPDNSIGYYDYSSGLAVQNDGSGYADSLSISTYDDKIDGLEYSGNRATTTSQYQMITNGVWQGGNAKSATETKGYAQVFDNDPNDFVSGLPTGTIYIESGVIDSFSNIAADDYTDERLQFTINDTDLVVETRVRSGVERTGLWYKGGMTEQNKAPEGNSYIRTIGDGENSVVSMTYPGAAKYWDTATGELKEANVKVEITQFSIETNRAFNAEEACIMLADARSLRFEWDYVGAGEYVGGVETKVRIKIEDNNGNPIEGSYLFAPYDLDTPSYDEAWNNNVKSTKYAEGFTINSGATSYAVIPRWDHAGQDLVLGDTRTGNRWERRNRLLSRTDLYPYLSNIYDASDRSADNYYSDVYYGPLAIDDTNSAKDGTANGIRFFATSIYGATRNDADTYDTGFAVLLDAKEANLTWTGSMQSQDAGSKNTGMATKLFPDSKISQNLSYAITPSHGTGGTLGIKAYNTSNNCEEEIKEDMVTVGAFGSSTVIAAPKPGYRVSSIWLDDGTLSADLAIDGTNVTLCNIKYKGSPVQGLSASGSFSSDQVLFGDLVKKFPSQFSGVYPQTFSGVPINLITLKRELNENDEYDYSLIIDDIHSNIKVHADFATDYHVTKTWMWGEPSEDATIELTATPYIYDKTTNALIEYKTDPNVKPQTFEVSANQHSDNVSVKSVQNTGETAGTTTDMLTWEIDLPSEGKSEYGWPKLPIETEYYDSGTHDTEHNHVQPIYWFVKEATDKLPDEWEFYKYDNSKVTSEGSALHLDDEETVIDRLTTDIQGEGVDKGAFLSIVAPDSDDPRAQGNILNKPDKNVSHNITAYKTLENGYVEPNLFSFTLTADGNTPMPGTHTDDEAGNVVRNTGGMVTVRNSDEEGVDTRSVVQFDDITFTYDDLIGEDGTIYNERTFTYALRENDPSDPRYTKDADSKTIKLTLKNDNGELTVTQSPDPSGSDSNELVFNNTFTPVTISAKKQWGTDDRDVPAENSSVTLTLREYDVSDGAYKNYEGGSSNPKTLSGSGASYWQNAVATWEDVPRYKDRKPVVYSVFEGKLDGYSTQVTSGKTSFKINTTASGGWKTTNANGVIKVNLLRNGLIYDTQEIKSENDWAYTWEGLDIVDPKGSGVIYLYDYEIVKPDGLSEEEQTAYTDMLNGWDHAVEYAPSGDSKNPTKISVSVVNTKQYITVNAVKRWNDNGATDKRGDLTMSLNRENALGQTLEENYQKWEYKNDTETVTKNKANHTFNKSPVMAGGVHNVYALSETTLPSSNYYQDSVEANGKINLGITTSEALVEVWSKRTDSPTIEVTLTGNGASLETVTLSKDNQYKCTWPKKPTVEVVTNNGKQEARTIVYDWKVNSAEWPADWEFTTAGFQDQYGESKVDGSNLYSMTVVNTLLKDVKVKKTWSGTPLQDVKVELVRWKGENQPTNGDYKKTDPDENSSWEYFDRTKEHVFARSEFTDPEQTVEYKFEKLPAYDLQGNEYFYGVYEASAGAYFSKEHGIDTTGDLTVKNTNTFTGTDKALLSVSKALEGRNWKTDDTFTFKLEPVSGAKDGKTLGLPNESNLNEWPNLSTEENGIAASATATATDASAGVATFPEIGYTFGEAGANHAATFTYKITEANGTDAGTPSGLTYSDASYLVEVSFETVGDSNAVQASYTYYTTSDSGQKAEELSAGQTPVFTNTYNASGEFSISVGKTIPNYVPGIYADTFNFEVRPLSDAIMPEGMEVLTTSIAPDISSHTSGTTYEGTSQTLNIPVTLGDLHHIDPVTKLAYGQFVYQVTEVPGDANFNYDSSEIYVRVTVKDNGQGELTSSYEYFTSPLCSASSKIAGAANAHFTNSQLRSIAVEKKWDGKVMTDSVVHIERKSGDDWVLAQDVNGNDAILTFGRIDSWTTEEGAADSSRTLTMADLPIYDASGNEITYRIREVSPTTDNGFTISYGEAGTSKDPEVAAAYNASTPTVTLHVTNSYKKFTQVQVAAVKELLGRTWLGSTVDDYDFILTATGIDRNNSGDLTKVPMPNKTYGSNTNDAGVLASQFEKDGLGHSAKRTSGKLVSEYDEYLAMFAPITISVDDLEYNAKTGHFERDFYYTLQEVTPTAGVDGITSYTQGGIDYLLNTKTGISYPRNEVHTVHIHAQDDLHGNVTAYVHYDEGPSNLNMGTPYTPVITNEYSASGSNHAVAVKTLAGRAWSASDKFDFSIQPLSGAPFRATASEPIVAISESHSREYILANGNMASDGTTAYVRLTGKTGEDGASHSVNLPELNFLLSDLAHTVQAGSKDEDGNAIAYSEGSEVPAGLKYDTFVYAIAEAEGDDSSILYDGDTEYAKFTVIDKGDGTLDVSVKYYEDRYCTIERSTVGAPFYNVDLMHLTVTKAWVGVPNADAEVVLERAEVKLDGATVEAPAANSSAWKKADSHVFWHTAFQTSATASYTFTDLPTRAVHMNSNNEDELYKVYYRVVEDVKNDAEGNELYAVSVRSGNSTSEEGNSVVVDPDANASASGAHTVVVTNTSLYNASGEAYLSAVKELTGRPWHAASKDDAGETTEAESYSFVLKPLGKATYNNNSQVATTSSGKVIYAGNAEEVPLPKDDPVSHTTVDSENNVAYVKAIGNDDPDDPQWLSESQRQANFASITYTQDNLQKTANGIWQADFYYELYEAVPEGAQAVLVKKDVYEFNVYEQAPNEDDFDGDNVDESKRFLGTITQNKVKYPVLWRKDGVLYTNDVHTVHVHVQDNDGELVTSVSYDDKPVGSTVPVFSNSYDASGMDYTAIVKHIEGRAWNAATVTSGDEAAVTINGDAFRYYIRQVGGAIMNPTDDAKPKYNVLKGGNAADDGNYDIFGGGILDADTWMTPAVTKSSQVVATSEGSVDVDYADRAIRSGEGTYHLGQLTYNAESNRYEGKFVHTITEVQSYEDKEGVTRWPKVEDLMYDTNTIYMQTYVWDNGDGTLSTEHRYFSEATCSDASEIKNPNSLDGKLPYQVFVNDRGYPVANDSEDRVATVNAAYFTNRASADIKVRKTWYEPVMQDVEIQLQRIDLNKDGQGIQVFSSKPADTDVPAGATVVKAVNGNTKYYVVPSAATWEYVNGTTNRNDFTVSSFAGTDTTVDETNGTRSRTITYEDMPLFSEDGHRYAYRVVEMNASNSYIVAYTLEDGDETIENGAFSGSGTLVITNTPRDGGRTNVAAVKQLMDRQWNSNDEFTFTLTPLGKATYNAEGKMKTREIPIGGKDVKIPEYVIKADGSYDTSVVPMPTKTVHNDETGKDESKEAPTASAKADGDHQVVGEGERLATFADIPFTMDDLVYDPTDKHMQGDFFYKLTEDIPAGAVAVVRGSREAVEPEIQLAPDTTDEVRDSYDWFDAGSGLYYDGRIHFVHIRVRENGTNKLEIQVFYDETDVSANAGTQFTPVFTNHYNATTADVVAKVWKQKLGGNWSSSDSFDFTMQSLAGAPFRDGDATEFEADGIEDARNSDSVAALLDVNKAAHTSEGAHVIRLRGVDSRDGAEAITKDFPKLAFQLSDLTQTVPSGNAEATDPIKKSNGALAPVGTKFGRFAYAIEEVEPANTVDHTKDGIKYDEDTEYVRITVIDNEDGTIDSVVEYYKDRFFKVKRIESNGETSFPGAPFTNAVLHSVWVQKTWDGIADENVTVHLKRAAVNTSEANKVTTVNSADAGAGEGMVVKEVVDGDNTTYYAVPNDRINDTVVTIGSGDNAKHYLVADSEWTEEDSHTFEKDEFDKVTSKKHEFKNLMSSNATTDASGKITKSIYVYRIVEDGPRTEAGFTTTYPHQVTSGNLSTEEYGAEGNPLVVENKSNYGSEGKLQLQVAKTLEGRTWNIDDSNSWNDFKMFQMRVTAAKEQNGIQTPMPRASDEDYTKVEQTSDAGVVSVVAEPHSYVTTNRYRADFSKIKYTKDHLAWNETDQKWENDFVYTLSEVIPPRRPS